MAWWQYILLGMLLALLPSALVFAWMIWTAPLIEADEPRQPQRPEDEKRARRRFHVVSRTP